MVATSSRRSSSSCFEQSGAADKTAMELAWADHYLHPVGDEGARLAGPYDGVIDMIAAQIEAHIGAS